MKKAAAQMDKKVQTFKKVCEALSQTLPGKNLDHPEYMEILLDGCGTLEERFAKIDSHAVVERLRTERKSRKQAADGMRQIIQRPDLPERLTQLLAGRQY